MKIYLVVKTYKGGVKQIMSCMDTADNKRQVFVWESDAREFFDEIHLNEGESKQLHEFEL